MISRLRRAAVLLLLFLLLGQGVLGAPPTARFSYKPERPEPMEDIFFLDGSTDPDGQVVTRLWDFGDGNTGRARNPTHAYGKEGTYTVTLVVVDDKGERSSPASKAIIIKKVTPGPPVVDFTFAPENPMAGALAVFTDLSTDPDDNMAEWLWDFGDGGRYVESGRLGQPITRRATHAYPLPGSYSVNLTVVDSKGGQGSKVKNVRVLPTAAPAIANPGYSQNPGATPPPLSPTSSPSTGEDGIGFGGGGEQVISNIMVFLLIVFVIIVVMGIVYRRV